jgi:hypothetical protein
MGAASVGKRAMTSSKVKSSFSEDNSVESMLMDEMN